MKTRRGIQVAPAPLFLTCIIQQKFWTEPGIYTPRLCAPFQGFLVTWGAPIFGHCTSIHRCWEWAQWLQSKSSSTGSLNMQKGLDSYESFSPSCQFGTWKPFLHQLAMIRSHHNWGSTDSARMWSSAVLTPAGMLTRSTMLSALPLHGTGCLNPCNTKVLCVQR